MLHCYMKIKVLFICLRKQGFINYFEVVSELIFHSHLKPNKINECDLWFMIWVTCMILAYCTNMSKFWCFGALVLKIVLQHNAASPYIESTTYQLHRLVISLICLMQLLSKLKPQALPEVHITGQQGPITHIKIQ